MPDVNEVVGNVLDNHIKTMQGQITQLSAQIPPPPPPPRVFGFRALVVAFVIGVAVCWIASAVLNTRSDRYDSRRGYEWP